MVTTTALTITAGLTVTTGSAASAAAARPGTDFNGDGYRDSAIAAPGGTVEGVRAGYVAVVYGSPAGLDLRKRQIINQATADVPDEPEVGDGFGSSVAAGDFNGDGFADLAVGAAGESLEGNYFLGSVTVLFGSAKGLGRGYLLPGDRGAGRAVGAGDVNGDGQVELLANGYTYVTGTIDVYAFLRGAFGDPSVALGGDDWGGEDWIATGDVNGDGSDDVLAAWTGVGGTQYVNYLPGSADGIRGDSPQTFDGGAHIAVGDINRDGHADLVSGQPLSAPYGPALGGRIHVRFGSSDGLDEEHVQAFDQDTAGVPGTAEYGDEFGSSVAVGDVDGDGYADVAVGVQSKSPGAKNRAGAVVLLRGGATGVTVDGARSFTQDSKDVPDTAEEGDQLGWMVTLIDHNKDGRADLTATAIGEDKSYADATYGNGAVTVLQGSSSGLTTKGARTFGPAALGADPADAHFGSSLTP
jgi:hypothetical protein